VTLWTSPLTRHGTRVRGSNKGWNRLWLYRLSLLWVRLGMFLRGLLWLEQAHSHPQFAPLSALILPTKSVQLLPQPSPINITKLISKTYNNVRTLLKCHQLVQLLWPANQKQSLLFFTHPSDDYCIPDVQICRSKVQTFFHTRAQVFRSPKCKLIYTLYMFCILHPQ